MKQLTEVVLEAEIESHLSTEINNRKMVNLLVIFFERRLDEALNI